MCTGMIPKPCHSCGRVITPRPKWARNWAAIRFCSDRCRSEKSVRLGGRGIIASVPIGHTADWKKMAIGRALQRVDAPSDESAEGVQTMRLDIDAWAEEVLLRLADGTVIVSKDMHDWAPVSDAETIMRQEAHEVWGCKAATSDHIERDKDDQPDDFEYDSERDQQTSLPGEATSEPSVKSMLSGTLGSALRERIRRAARRRIVLDSSSWAREGGEHLEVWGTPVLPGAGKDEKVRGGPKSKAKAKRVLPIGAKRLESLDDVSYARAEMYLRVKGNKR